MGTTYKSPYAASFKSGIKRGTPPFVLVNNIASRKNVNPQKVWESLYKGGIVNRQKFNGQWLYWPVECGKVNATNTKVCQFNMWQWFVDWCICNGCCTPEMLNNNKGSQKEFEAYFKKFWNKQFSPSTPSKGRKRSTGSSRKPRTTASRKRGTSTTLKYRSGRKSTTGRYSRAA